MKTLSTEKAESSEKASVNTPPKSTFTMDERVPSAWILTAGEEGTVHGRHSVTGRNFEGTMKEFNAALRG